MGRSTTRPRPGGRDSPNPRRCLVPARRIARRGRNEAEVVMRVPFNRPRLVGTEFRYLHEAAESGRLSGNGEFGLRCARWLEDRTGASRALMTHSCTGALEMAALLLRVGEGDEVIMPSFTFVSTANAFVLRGATPVFVDIREDTLNIDESLIENAITPRTRAICVV